MNNISDYYSKINNKQTTNGLSREATVIRDSHKKSHLSFMGNSIVNYQMLEFIYKPASAITNDEQELSNNQNSDTDMLSNAFELIQQSHSIFSGTEPLGGKLRELLDVALLASASSEPVVKGMK